MLILAPGTLLVSIFGRSPLWSGPFPGYRANFNNSNSGLPLIMHQNISNLFQSDHQRMAIHVFLPPPDRCPCAEAAIMTSGHLPD